MDMPYGSLNKKKLELTSKNEALVRALIDNNKAGILPWVDLTEETKHLFRQLFSRGFEEGYEEYYIKKVKDK